MILLKKHEDISYNSDRKYKIIEWTNWDDFLGIGKSSRRPFEGAREFTRQLGLKTHGERRKYCQSKYKPNTIPSNPDKAYKNKG